MAEENGLTSAEARELLEEYGPNKLPEKPPPSDFQILFNQFKSPLVYVLLGAAAITLFLREFGDAMVIGIAVLINTVLGFLQERKANNELKALKNLINPKATVIRGGEQMTIPIAEVVPGDIAVLNTGEKIPADGQIQKAVKLYAEEAILTGESVPVEKSQGDKVFMGTIVTGGRGYMKVETTGPSTEIGKIATSVQESEVATVTPLSRQLSVFSRQLTYLIVLMTLFVFVVGTFSGRDLAEVFITSVALAVSAIPEGLLVSLTVVLAIGMQRILKRKGLVRSLVSAETLGGVTTICADKTGTLTEGKMQVVEVLGDEKEIIHQAILANDRDDPIVVAAWDWAKQKTSADELLSKHPRLDEMPFDSEERFSATLNKFPKNNKILVNGAPEYLVEWSDLSKVKKQEILSKIEDFTSRGMRVMGMAEKTVSSDKKSVTRKDIVKGKLKWKGLMVYSDPVRPGVKSALVKTREAGIRLIIITGDYKKTAMSVLSELDVKVEPRLVFEGSQLEKMSESELAKILSKKENIVFARTQPHGKLKIVEALKANGEIVAMTGDGVNDAPALSRADIGVVVESATDVAKESSDLVLLNSSFSTIVAAIEEGRVIFDNIRKILMYLMSDAFEGIFLVLGVIVAGASFHQGLPLPVTAAQVLYINLISDGLPNLALTVDPKREGAMQEPPRNPKEKLVSAWVKSLIFIVSLTGGITAFIIFYLTYTRTQDIELARSIAFATLGINSLFYVSAVRALTKPFWTVNMMSNKWLLAAIVGGFGLQFAPFWIRPLGNFFEIVPIGLGNWMIVFAASAVMFIVIELTKAVYRANTSHNLNH